MFAVRIITVTKVHCERNTTCSYKDAKIHRVIMCINLSCLLQVFHNNLPAMLATGTKTISSIPLIASFFCYLCFTFITPGSTQQHNNAFVQNVYSKR